MANQEIDEVNVETEEKTDPSQNQQGGEKKKASLLDYTLQPMKDAAIFVLHSQSPKVTNFLKKGVYLATNGMRITLGAAYPEWKDSKNIIYLDGTNGVCLGRPDITRFPPNNKKIRDNKMMMFNTALRELINVVRELDPEPPKETTRPVDGRIRLS